MKHIEDAHSDSIVLNIALVNSIRKPVRPAARADFLAEERGRTKQPFWIVQMNHAREAVLVVVTSCGRAKAIQRAKER
jgi:hypothetical protein